MARTPDRTVEFQVGTDEMDPGLVVLLVATAVLLIWIVATVNRFVRLRQHLRESWADIDVELKRRYDLIPNLVEKKSRMENL